MSREWDAWPPGGVKGLEVMQDGPPGVGMTRAWPWSLDRASWGVVLASEPPPPRTMYPASPCGICTRHCESQT